MLVQAVLSQPAPDLVKVETALLSVSDKTGLVEFAKGLQDLGIRILSTGGTYKALEEAGIKAQDVAAYTGFPEIMDGRVKTLHPKVHGGILARRNNADDKRAMQDNGIGGIDLVVVNLYPFAATVAKGANFNTCVENIDIGGPAMIRAAAKNHAFVTVVTDTKDYKAVLADLGTKKNSTTLALRQRLAAAAFAHTAHYDTQIARWFASQPDQHDWPPYIGFSGALAQSLRYGENPHQSAALYTDGTNRPGVATAKQVQGKELSYNNLNDTDAAYELVAEFSEPAVAIIKHANPCGVSVAANTLEAYKRALMCDPVSAFGGIIALNRPLDFTTAQEILKIFCEVIIAPSVDADVMALLKKKDKVRVLTTDGKLPEPMAPRLTVRTIAGGLLVQSADSGRIEKNHLKVATKRAPTDEELKDMLFAFRVAKHVKSNAIVYAKDMTTVGIGAGQMSRLDSSRIAARKAVDAAQAANIAEPLTKGSVVASDAFFPFADGLIAAADAGVTAVIQPGGSMRDDEVIKAADERNLAMVFTSMRHFRH